MNIHTTIPPADTAAAIWADACGNRTAIIRNPQRFIRLAELLSRFERNDMENAVELLIATLDAIDGDAEAEPVDEREPDEDARGDPAWTEFHTRGRHKLQYGHEPVRGIDGRTARDDDEDEDVPENDDPAEDDDPAGGDFDDIPEGAAWNEGVCQTVLIGGTSEDDERLEALAMVAANVS
jgi:hypothetical protein